MEEFEERPGGAFTVEAGEFLIELAKASKLPGFAASEHGTMHAGILDGNAETPADGAPEAYPVSRAIHFQKDGDPSNYFYIVVRKSQHDSWRLQKAWRADADGNVVQTYEVP